MRQNAKKLVEVLLKVINSYSKWPKTCLESLNVLKTYKRSIILDIHRIKHFYSLRKNA